jgi:hypothetical protein
MRRLPAAAWCFLQACPHFGEQAVAKSAAHRLSTVFKVRQFFL